LALPGGSKKKGQNLVHKKMGHSKRRVAIRTEGGSSKRPVNRSKTQGEGGEHLENHRKNKTRDCEVRPLERKKKIKTRCHT